MRRALWLPLFALSFFAVHSACGGIRTPTRECSDCGEVLDGGDQSGPPSSQPPTSEPQQPSTQTDASMQLPEGPDASTSVLVEPWISGRSRLGARTGVAFGAWRRGLAVFGDRLFWVEGGDTPGLYSAALNCQADGGSCAQKIATLTRPSAFTATSGFLYIADTNVLKRYDLAKGEMATLASHTEEIVNLGSNDARVFWTAGGKGNIFSTRVEGTTTPTTSTPIFSNGTPSDLGMAADYAFWVGLDISGLNGAMQTIRADGTDAHEVLRFAGGFQALGGNSTFLYYAENSPAIIHRLTVATGRNEVVDREGVGVREFAFSGGYAYWVEPGDPPGRLNGRLRRVGHDSMKAQTLADSIPYPVAVVVSGRTAFVASVGTSAKSYADGTILKITLPAE